MLGAGQMAWRGRWRHVRDLVAMNGAQHKFFEMTVQSLGRARAGLHDVAWVLLGLLMLSAILALGLLSVWVLRGGLSRYSSLESAEDRRAFEDWLRES